MDGQARLESVAGLAALVHALAVACADGAEEDVPPHRGAEGVQLPRGPRRHRRDDLVARRACGRSARSAPTRSSWPAPTPRDLDAEDALEEIERILREGGGADRMREAHAAGGMSAVLCPPCPETYGSTQTTSPIRSQS